MPEPVTPDRWAVASPRGVEFLCRRKMQNGRTKFGTNDPMIDRQTGQQLQEYKVTLAFMGGQFDVKCTPEAFAEFAEGQLFTELEGTMSLYEGKFYFKCVSARPAGIPSHNPMERAPAQSGESAGGMFGRKKTG